jgi:hypothetical protein
LNSTTPIKDTKAGRAFPPIVGVVLCLLFYGLAVFFTGAYFMGDTMDYSKSIAERAAGRNYFFWEFGHLLWRPLGYVLFTISAALARRFTGENPQAGATLVLICISGVTGLVAVLSLFGILNRICRQKWPIIVSVLALIGSQSFLNYLHSGAPYIPGLSFLLLAMYLLVAQGRKEKSSVLVAIGAGASLALSGLFWFPYIFAIPAALLTPLILLGYSTQRLKAVLLAAVAGIVIGGSVYFAVMAHLGIHNVAELRGWMQQTSRNTGAQNGGVGKMVFGFARSFVAMGKDGMLFKRFLIHDPFNPVSAWDLLRLSLWKLLAFYLFLLFLFLSLITSSSGRRVFALMLLSWVPVLAFAVYWQGGDPERYLPLYPLFFIALCWALHTAPKKLFKYPLLLFVLLMLLTNGFTLAKARLQRQQQANVDRISPLVPLLKPGSKVFVANWQDDLVNFNRSFPLNPINRSGDVRVAALITPGEDSVAHWPQDFWSNAQAIWNAGGDVWISKRLLAARPQPGWNWVEGDDRRVSWTDLHNYAAGLELGQSIGGDDGFALLLPTDQNKRYLSEYHRN